MAKEEKQLDDADKEFNAKKDLFWKLFFIAFFLVSAAIMHLSQYSWYSPTFTILIILIAAAGVVFGPGYLYPRVKSLYDVFQNREYATAEDQNRRGRAKLIYNLFVFFGLFLIAGPLANAIALFVFHKNKTADTILIILFDIGALVLSIYITEKKAKNGDK